jgi:hypothetical protein
MDQLESQLLECGLCREDAHELARATCDSLNSQSIAQVTIRTRLIRENITYFSNTLFGDCCRAPVTYRFGMRKREAR